MDNNTINSQPVRNREYAFPEIQSPETIRELLTRKAELTAREKHTEEKLACYRTEIVRTCCLRKKTCLSPNPIQKLQRKMH